jgi:hypothetical protein
MRQRGFETNSITKSKNDSPGNQELYDWVNENPNYYKTMDMKETMEFVIDEIEGRGGFDDATVVQDLTKGNTTLEESARVQFARMAALKHYGQKITQLRSDGASNAEVDAAIAVMAKIEKALESGQYDGVKIKAEGQTMVTVLEPSQIRSVNAAFDPAKASSSNLLASNPIATAAAGLLANVTGQPSNLSSYMQGNTDAYLTNAERQYLQNKQAFESNFSDDTGWDRADILPFRVNEQTGEREFATPEMIKGLLSGLYDIGQSKNTKISNPASLLELI